MTGPDRPWAYSAFRVAVARVSRPSSGFVPVTLAGAGLRHFARWGLDQRIKLVLPMPDGSEPDFGLLADPTPHPREWYARWKALPEEGRNVLRTYTPAAVRPERGEIDVDVFVHQPPGPASAWASTCAPGDRLVVTGPDVRAGHTGYGIHYVPPQPPRRVLLIGDESALPAVGNILSALDPETTADVVLELADRADLAALRAAEGSRVRVRLGERGAVPGAGWQQSLRAWETAHGAEAAADPRFYAWIAGEAAACTGVRRHLTGVLGVPKERVAFLGYWKLGGPLVA